MKKQNTPPATGTTFAKGITTSTVIDAVKAREGADKKAFDAQWEEARQLGYVHRYAESTKKATGRTISDHLEPIAHAAGVVLKSLQNRAGEGRKLVDAKGLTTARRDALRKQLEKDGQKVSVRNVIKAHIGAKTEQKSSTPKEDQPTVKPGTVRTTVDAKVAGSNLPATANLSDDPKVAPLEWVALGMKAAKDCNVTWNDWLKDSGLQVIPAKVTA